METEAAGLAGMIDGVVEQRRAAARAEAELAGRMVAFCAARRRDDQARQVQTDPDGDDRHPAMAPNEFAAGEFAADELSLATTMSVYEVQCLIALTRRIQSRLPSVWDAWRAGDIDRAKVTEIDRCLRRLATDAAVYVLEMDVLDAAIGKARKQLRSWLHRFVARHEAEQHRQREAEAYADRYVSRRHEPDGVGFLTARGSTMDVEAADQRLTDLAVALGAADARSIDQRRCDLLFDLVLGRIDNGNPGHPLGGATDPGPVTTTIGVVVPVTSVVGDCDTPGELIDRSATVPASVIRHLATQRGTLFFRLLTDPRGHLIDVTELGRYPSHKLGWALDLRAGTCIYPTCTVSASRCDHDHHVPHPNGPTSGANLDPECRHQHRGKTHAGFRTSRAGPTVTVVTPTGYTYTRTDTPLPVEAWAVDPVGDELERAAIREADAVLAELFANQWSAGPPEPVLV
jgi:Domain of unknown function (DUF222)